MNRFQHASNIWSLLVCAARERKTYTYGEISGIIGVPPVGIGQHLGPVYVYCQTNTLPILTVLAVNATTGTPYSNLYKPIEDLNSYREDVFNFDWFKRTPPQTHDFEQAYKSHSHLLEDI